jgi:hypothetical protein
MAQMLRVLLLSFDEARGWMEAGSHYKSAF